jgi:hypothetical protein
MALEVIGAGFGRTGTLSLKRALERLGFGRCYHMVEVFEHPEHMDVWAAAHRGEAVDWEALFDGYRAAVDWPSCNLWREQMEAFPQAKVILSTRDPEGWYASVCNTILPATLDAAASDDPARRRFGEWANEIIWNRVFDGRMDDREHALAVYRAHVDRVRAEVPGDRLLVFEAGQGWEPLCAFLGVPVPEEDYPRSNSTEEFLAHGGAATGS